MTDPVYSPDGKFMWTGSEWIPAPPAAEPEPVAPSEQALNMPVSYTHLTLPTIYSV